MGTDNFLIRRLHSEISKLLEYESFGGSDALFRLEQLAWDCCNESAGNEKAVCAGIAAFLDRIAKSQEGEAVLADSASSLAAAISQPLIQCLDYLIGRDSGRSPEAMLSDLNEAYQGWVQRARTW
jgi:hypothetical protein